MSVILLTGATGVLGSELVRSLVARDQNVTINCLIRAETPGEFEEKVRFVEDWIGPQSLQKNLHFVKGDLRKNELGLTPTLYSDLSRTVTQIVHCAADLNLGRPLLQSRSEAVQISNQILTFARAARRQLGQVAYLSTVGVGGTTIKTLKEEPIEGECHYRNSYEDAKATAERIFLAAAKSGLPVVVHRPSMIVGRSTDGKIARFQIFYRLAELWSGSLSYQLVPHCGEFKLDIIPVDTAADFIGRVLEREFPPGTIFNLCGGRDLSLSPKLIGAELAARRRDNPKTISVPAGLYGAALRLITQCVDIRRLRFIPFVLPYLKGQQRFENTRTVALMAEFGIQMPDPLSVVQRCLTTYLASSTQRELHEDS
jgi:thioester reductase-like protein